MPRPIRFKPSFAQEAISSMRACADPVRVSSPRSARNSCRASKRWSARQYGLTTSTSSRRPRHLDRSPPARSGRLAWGCSRRFARSPLAVRRVANFRRGAPGTRSRRRSPGERRVPDQDELPASPSAATDEPARGPLRELRPVTRATTGRRDRTSATASGWRPGPLAEEAEDGVRLGPSDRAAQRCRKALAGRLARDLAVCRRNAGCRAFRLRDHRGAAADPRLLALTSRAGACSSHSVIRAGPSSSGLFLGWGYVPDVASLHHGNGLPLTGALLACLGAACSSAKPSDSSGSVSPPPNWRSSSPWRSR